MKSIKFLMEILFVYLIALPICICLLILIEIFYFPQTLKTLKQWTKNKLKNKVQNFQ